MITSNPIKWWNTVSEKSNWREYILPKRNDEEFYEEGKKQADRLSRFYKYDDIVLEFGCGIGRILRYIKASRKIGLDICSKYIEIAKEEDKTSEYYTYFDEEVDFIYCLSVMQHNTAKQRLKIMEKIKELLKTGGSAFISFPSEFSEIYKESSFVHKFTKEEVAEYGRMFSLYSVNSGNLVNYGDKKDTDISNEYFLIVKK